MIKDLVTERLKLRDVYPDRAKTVAEESGIDIDDLELIRKGIVAEKAAVNKEERSVTSYINTAAKDRDNEVILPKGVVLTHYRKNPVVPYGHDYRGLPVAKNIWIKKDDKGLLAKTVFLDHAFAEDVYRLYSESVAGTGPAMKAWSIGFIPLKWEDSKTDEDDHKRGERDTKPRRTYKKWELLEYSAVMIPSNPEALTQMVEKGLIKSEKLIQEIGELIEIEDEPEPLIEDVCPECQGQLGADGEGSYCKQCEWTDIDSKKDSILILKRVITKPEENDKEIRIPAKGEEGKHGKHKIRWVTVSAQKGIKGLYCIDCKKIITYVFDKGKGWTMVKALKWMKDNGKNIERIIEAWVQTDTGTKFEDTAWLVLNQKLESYDSEDEIDKTDNSVDSFGFLKNRGENLYSSEDGEEIELEDETKGVIPFRDTPKAPEDAGWNGPREIRAAEISDLKVMCTWFDAENPDTKGAYKLPHHQAKGHKVVWRAVAAAMAALFGTRGGVQLPDKDRKGVYNHLAKEYKKFDKEPPEFKEYTEEELKELFSDEVTLKRPDLQGNPSIWDILDAIEQAINLGVIGPRRKWVTDLYPIKYPNGNVVIGVREEGTKYFLYPYTYKEGDITFGEATELEQTYEPKREEPEGAKTDRLIDRMEVLADEIKDLKEGRVLSEKNRKLILNVLVAMEAVMPPLRSLLTATEPPKEEAFELDIDKGEDDGNGGKDDPDPDSELRNTIDKDNPEKLDIDAEQLTVIVQGVFKNNFEKIAQMVADKIARAKGKVE